VLSLKKHSGFTFNHEIRLIPHKFQVSMWSSKETQSVKEARQYLVCYY